MIEIPVGRKLITYIDDEDLDLVKSYHWYKSIQRNTIYARTRDESTSFKDILIHRVIMGVVDIPWRISRVDHIDHNGLNNVKTNLRFVDSGQNQQNRAFTFGASNECGVAKSGNRWRAYIWLDGKQKHIQLEPKFGKEKVKEQERNNV